MNTHKESHGQNIFIPCVVYAAIVGVITGGIVFLFRLLSEYVIELSHWIFSSVHEYPQFLPLLIVGAVLAGLVVALCLSYSPHSRGGGIPTAVALLRGIITFHWLRNIIFVFTSALFSYLCGIPLGNDEGPAVQMGAAVGSGVTNVFAKKHRAWERYLMTGGATAGFATATGAPVAAILFGLEEAHRRFSPLLIMSSASSVLCGMGILELLCALTGRSSALFHFEEIIGKLPLTLIWVAIPIGLLCGGFAFAYAAFCHFVRGFMHKHLKHVHPFFKVAPVFVVVVLVGSVWYECVGTGHHFIQELLDGHRVEWYIALAFLLIRAVLVTFSNDVGATGGLFTPLLVFGSLIGSLAAEAMIALGWLQPQYFVLMVVIGMTSFFGASVRTPLTAMVFSVEVFAGAYNILPILLATVIAYVTVELIGVTSINEIAMEREIHNEHRGKLMHVVDVKVVARPGSFAIGKEPRDILWPNTCTVLALRDDDNCNNYAGGHIRENNILLLNFTTFDPARTERELCAILGEQVIYDEDVVRYETYSDHKHKH